MRKVELIEQKILELTSAEFVELRDWVLEQDWAAWEAKVGKDSCAGKLADLVAEAKHDYKSGKARSLC